MSSDLSQSIIERYIARGMAYPVFVVDSRFRILFYNDSLLNLLGISPLSNLLQKTCYSTFYNLDQPCRFCPLLSSNTPLPEGEVHELTVSSQSDPLSKDIHLSIKVFVVNDPVLGKLVFEYPQDVTRIKEKQEELKRNEQLVALGLVTRLVAHELQNPLTGINLTLQTLPNAVNNAEELDKKIEIIQRDLETARLIIADIQNFNRRDGLQMKKINLRKLLDDILTLMKRLAPRSRAITDVEFRLFYKLPKNSQVFGNETRLHQVFMNLFKNSFDAAQRVGRSPRPLIFWIVARKVVLPQNDNSRPQMHAGPFAQLEIIDNAGGISQDALKRVFDPFFTTRKGSNKGSGLGLFLVQKILDEHTAEIDMQSKGHYTRVTLRLDLVS